MSRRHIQLLAAPLGHLLTPRRRRQVARRQRHLERRRSTTTTSAPSGSNQCRQDRASRTPHEDGRLCDRAEPRPALLARRLLQRPHRRRSSAPDFRTGTIRNVPESEKHAVESEYGMAAAAYGRTIEIDHIVSLELGGSNDIANLFPEPGAAPRTTTSRTSSRTAARARLRRLDEPARRTVAGSRANWEALYTRVFGVAPSRVAQRESGLLTRESNVELRLLTSRSCSRCVEALREDPCLVGVIVGLDEPRSDRGGEHREKADADEHQGDADGRAWRLSSGRGRRSRR